MVCVRVELGLDETRIRASFYADPCLKSSNKRSRGGYRLLHFVESLEN